MPDAVVHDTGGSEHEAALARAIASAEDAFQQMSVAKDGNTKKLWSTKAHQSLLEAEHLKSRVKYPSSGAVAPDGLTSKDTTVTLKVPKVTRELPKSEQILLLKASYVNGSKYPPWSETPSASEFALQPGQGLYSDDAAFSISAFQEKVFDGWKRPNAALITPTMVHKQPIDLVQDAATDCSVVASLCAGVARQKRGHAKLTSAVIHPWDAQSGYPSISQNGKYIVRLNFNGCFRRVVIDDMLPTSRTARFIHVVDRQNPGLLWPALIEKAYLKVRGGYDFPGSNSATDLWMVTGWIPEQVFLQDGDLNLDLLWSRIMYDWSIGNVLITMGTGKMSTKVENEVGLAGEHDYAVLDLREVRGQRLLLIKNPWCEGTNWHRVPQRPATHSTPGGESEAPSVLHDMDHAAQSPRDLLNADSQLSPGTFWMDIDNVAQYFQSIYLNWNPGRFAQRQDLHFTWDLSTATQSPYRSLQGQPQFQIAAANGGPVWLLLCRHLDKTNETISSSTAVDLQGFISLAAYASNGSRVKLSGKVINKSNIVDSPQILHKLEDCLPGRRYTIVAAEHELPRKAHTFTISAFSNSELQLDHAAASHRCAITIPASWTRETAGGNANHISYSNNPQFSIVLTKASRLSVLLQAHQDDLNVHVKLVHGSGKRVRAVRNRDVVLDSGDYRRRACVAESKGTLEPGAYTAICSTFEPHHLGQFEILVESDTQATVTAIPRDGAGRLTKQSYATIPDGSTKIAAPLTPHRLVKFGAMLSLQESQQASASPMQLSIEQGRATQRRVISSSDDDDFPINKSGLARTQEMDLAPDMLQYGQLWLVITRVCAPGTAASQTVSLEILVDQPQAIELGKWTAVDE